jgi:hypothetical protein
MRDRGGREVLALSFAIRPRRIVIDDEHASSAAHA